MRRYTAGLIGTIALITLVMAGGDIRGHTAIASRYTYNEHVFAIFERQCGSCHVDGGVAPMSLLTYAEAYPWTQSIREEVLSLRMPPWKAEDGFGDFSNGHVLPAHELDMILEWSSGGYPQGPRDQTPTPPEPVTGWALGPPTLDLAADRFEFDAATSETVRYFMMDTAEGRDRWITAVDVRPRSRAVVRHVTVYVDTTGQARAADAADPAPGFSEGFDGQPVAVWWPGQSVVALDGVGYALPDGADVVARVLYKKTWITEGQAFTDQTHLGLHLTDSGVAAVEQRVLDTTAEPAGRTLAFSYEFDEDVTLLGLLPEIDIESAELQVEGVRPDGTREPLLLIREPDPGWPTRYWFDAPHPLPSGSRIEVTTTLRGSGGRQSAPSLFASDAPVRLLMDFTSSTAAN